MSESLDRFRRAFVGAARWKMAGAWIAGAGLAVGFFQDTYLGFHEGAPPGAVCAQSAALGVAIAVVFLWSFRSLAEARDGAAALTAMAAWRLWGRAAGGDLVGLLPWGVLVCASFHRFGASPPVWAIAVTTGLVLCLVVHLFVLPRRLRRDLEGWTPTERETEYGAMADDPVRVALGRVARWRLCGALLGLLSLALPWVYAETLPLLDPHADPRDAREGALDGWQLLVGEGTEVASVFAWLHLSGVLVLLCVSGWDRTRSKWPVAVRLVRARVSGAWITSLVPCLPALVLWLGSLATFARSAPLLAGAWVSFAGLLIGGAGTLLLPPILLRGASAARAEGCPHGGAGGP